MAGTILIPLAQGLRAEPALDAGFQLATKLKARLRALFVRPEPDAVIPYIPAQIGGFEFMRDEVEREGRQAGGLDKARYEGSRIRHNVPETTEGSSGSECRASWGEEIGEIAPVITKHSRISDLIMMSRLRANDVAAERCFDAAVFGSGRPTMLIPAEVSDGLLAHVLVAWNGSLESSHAVFGAMPLLRAADQVSVFNQPEGDRPEVDIADLIQVLATHGISGRPAAHSSVPCSAGAALLAVASVSNASLVVTGAYTHSRFRQELLRGVTSHVLAECTIPVLLTH